MPDTDSNMCEATVTDAVYDFENPFKNPLHA